MAICFGLCLLVMAIALHCELLILDEPTSSLDVYSQTGLVQLIKKIPLDFNMGALIITHNLHLAKELAEWVYIIHKGEVVETGHIENILSDPKHPHTRQIIQHFI